MRADRRAASASEAARRRYLLVRVRGSHVINEIMDVVLHERVLLAVLVREVLVLLVLVHVWLDAFTSVHHVVRGFLNRAVQASAGGSELEKMKPEAKLRMKSQRSSEPAT